MSGKSLRGPAPSLADACQPAPETAWVYLLRCPDGSLYGGWTNDLARRLKAHRTGKGGAKSLVQPPYWLPSGPRSR